MRGFGSGIFSGIPRYQIYVLSKLLGLYYKASPITKWTTIEGAFKADEWHRCVHALSSQRKQLPHLHRIYASSIDWRIQNRWPLLLNVRI